MSLDNILDNDGFSIAATGMVIVFLALSFISIFISLLPKILDSLSFLLPADPVERMPARRQTSDDEEVVAAIGFVLHHLETRNHETR